MRTYLEGPLGQWSPTFLAPGTGLIEDSFSTDRGNREREESLGLIQVHYIYCAQFFIPIYYFILFYIIYFISLFFSYYYLFILYFYCYCISSPSDHQALYPECDDPCFRNQCGPSSWLGAASLAGAGSPSVPPGSDFLSLLFLLL